MKHSRASVCWLLDDRLPNGNVEVNNGALLFLTVEEIEHIRMVNAHHRHVGAMTVLLLDDAKGGVVYLQE